MPADLGTVYVQDNVPEFMLYVVKNGKTIHSDKIAVGELRYATPIFSADMQTIVFNPEWTAPPTVVREDLLPNLRRGGWLRKLDLAAARTTGETQRPYSRSRQHQLEQRERGEHCLHPAAGAEECLGQS